MSDQAHTGGCQCGAVRFRVTKLGRGSICFCRMCQKATAGLGGLLITAEEFAWTRGAPKYFVSSNVARRGFCGDCGTPLTFESGGAVDLSIVAFDRPGEVPPTIQLAAEARIPWGDHLNALPPRPESPAMAERYARVVSYQHPDHDTDAWEARTLAATEPRQ
ncbi:MAG: GFA family protein [Hyphomicrobium sp.]|nr:GFA family protein [Hyphomicrobium sp.]